MAEVPCFLCNPEEHADVSEAHSHDAVAKRRGIADHNAVDRVRLRRTHPAHICLPLHTCTLFHPREVLLAVNVDA